MSEPQPFDRERELRVANFIAAGMDDGWGRLVQRSGICEASRGEESTRRREPLIHEATIDAHTNRLEKLRKKFRKRKRKR